MESAPVEDKEFELDSIQIPHPQQVGHSNSSSSTGWRLQCLGLIEICFFVV